MKVFQMSVIDIFVNDSAMQILFLQVSYLIMFSSKCHLRSLGEIQPLS